MSMPKVLRKLSAVRDALALSLQDACEEYANGKANGLGVGSGIVGDRFRGAGNNRFAPLNAKYAAWKDKAAKAQQAKRKQAGAKVRGGGKLPILVLTGLLRDSVTAGHAVITLAASGDHALIKWTGLPDYAKAHAQGGKLPVRHPVAPNDADKARFRFMLAKSYKQRTGAGRTSTRP